MKKFKIGNTLVGDQEPTYFVADIAANHDGSLSRAIELIHLCAESGANAAKFQNFKAETIASDFGFKSLRQKKSHQAGWKKSVYQVYDEASLSMEWTNKIKDECRKAGIDYFTAPYDIDLVDQLSDFVSAWKIGSGDITWLELIKILSKKDKPVLLATGASTMNEVREAMEILMQNKSDIVLMQCNTNYTASLENFRYINLSVLNSFKREFPNVILGLSDHTPGHSTVLGAITLGAKVIEKHFTDDTSRVGPDHKFSMDQNSWSEMVKRSRELELSLGNGMKIVENNESETVVLQRRALRTKNDLKAGTILNKDNIIPLRPCPKEALEPKMFDLIVNRVLRRDLNKGALIKFEDLI